MNTLQQATYTLEQIQEAGAKQGACDLTVHDITELYYELGNISMLRSFQSQAVEMTAIKDQKQARIQLSKWDLQAVQTASEELMLACEGASSDSNHRVSVEGRQAIFESGPTQADTQSMINRMQEFISYCQNHHPDIRFESISLSHHLTHRAYLSSANTQLEEVHGEYQFACMYVAKQKVKASSFNYFSFTMQNIQDPILVQYPFGDQLLAEAVKQLQTIPWLEKVTDGLVIISPAALGDLIAFLAATQLTDAALIEKRSIWKDQLGEQVVSPFFSLKLSPYHTDLPGARHVTEDGYVAQPMTVIKNGVLKQFILSDYAGLRTTIGRSLMTDMTYVVDPGTSNLEEMIASVPKGIYLNRLSGGNPAANGDFSGIAKNSFLIEDGQMKQALSETMVSFNVVDVLNHILDISKETVNNGTQIRPYLLCKGMTISGK